MTTLRPGTRVLANGQPGSVNYVRMAPPTFQDPEVYSVLLDSQALRPGYTGSIFLASEVVEATATPISVCPTCGTALVCGVEVCPKCKEVIVDLIKILGCEKKD